MEKTHVPKGWKTVNATLAEYRELYDAAVKDNQPEFILDGHTVLTKFAKYHLECLEMKKS